LKKIKVLKMETEEYEKAEVELGMMQINGVEHLVVQCPKCQTRFGIPVDTLKALLVHRKRPEGVV
jgi:hypothetical protein